MAVNTAFQQFYDNINHFQDYFALYWIEVAKSLSHLRNVLGYEIINEPFAGDIYTNPLLLMPQVAASRNLMPLYDKMYQFIRQYDKKTIVFYEPVTWGVLLNDKDRGTGFTRAPGNDPNGTVLSWHYYCWLYSNELNFGVNSFFKNLDRTVCTNSQRFSAFQIVKNAKDTIGGASFLTEFGLSGKRDDNGQFVVDDIIEMIDLADYYFESWAYWDSDFYTEDHKINNHLVNTFSRTYPQTTSGIPVSLSFNHTTKEFNYVYVLDTQIKEPTEIIVPQILYPNGIQIYLSMHLNWFYDASNNLLLVSPVQGTQSGIESVIRVTQR